MTNLVDKQRLVAALERTMCALNEIRPVVEICATMGAPLALGVNRGAHDACRALLDGILDGVYDEDALDIGVLVMYSEDEAEDTEPAGCGVVILPPCPSEEEQAELRKWYEDQGFITKTKG